MRQNKKENKNKRKNEEWIQKARHASSVKDIAHVIETMQFHRIFGLVDEQEVWDKLLILDEMYRRVFFIQEESFAAIKGETWSRVYDLTGQVVRKR